MILFDYKEAGDASIERKNLEKNNNKKEAQMVIDFQAENHEKIKFYFDFSQNLKNKFENLCSIFAIGNINSIAILSEIQDVSKFDSAL